MARPYTFNPPEEELINHYLNNKITGNDDLVESDMSEINICQHEPPNLPELAKIPSAHTWYFVSRVEKFGRSNRTKRATRTGHWKITGNSCMVKDNYGNPIGFKKFLVFQENKASSSSSNLPNKSTWIIHEFHSYLQHPDKEAFVLCKLMKKGGSGVMASADASAAAADPSLSFSSLDLSHPQNTTDEILMPRPSPMLHDHDYSLEEIFSEVNNPTWFTADHSIDLLHSQFRHLEWQCFADPIHTWNGGVPISQAESEINANYQIQETGELSGGNHENVEVVGGHGSSGGVGTDTVSNGRNEQIQDRQNWILGAHIFDSIDTWQYLIPRNSHF